MSGTSPLASIIIPCYNTAAYLPHAIKSALDQTYSPIEIVVIDDGSTDDTASIVAQYKNSAIKYVYQSNKGLSAARNTGIRMATGEYIALLDADDLWERDKLHKQIELLKKYPSCGMVFTDYSTFNTEGVLSRTRNADRHDGSVSYEQLLSRLNFIYCTVVIRCEVFEQCGYFDESLRSIEDYDMWLRIAQQFEIRGIRESLACIRIHNSSMTCNVHVMLEYERKVIDKHRNSFTWTAYRRRIAKTYFLNADRYIHQQQRIKSLELFFQGFILYPFLFVDMTVYCIKFTLGGRLIDRLRAYLTKQPSLLATCYNFMYKRY